MDVIEKQYKASEKKNIDEALVIKKPLTFKSKYNDLFY
jgi:hypothetical protein